MNWNCVLLIINVIVNLCYVNTKAKYMVILVKKNQR